LNLQPKNSRIWSRGSNVDSPYSRFFVNFSHGFKGLLDSDFKYEKIQLYYKQPIIGPLGRSNIMDTGKRMERYLGLLSVTQNQTFLLLRIPLVNLNFYEFVMTMQLYSGIIILVGRLFARIPFMRKLNWREMIGAKVVYGSFLMQIEQLMLQDYLCCSQKKRIPIQCRNWKIFKVFRLILLESEIILNT
jgi:hypothetical protein